jgi:peptidoglycan/LPS O-acetylase OafA/YrhL
VSLLLRIAGLLALAAALGIAGAYLCDAIIGPTHNVAAAYDSVLVGAAIALLTLAIGGHRRFRKRRQNLCATVVIDH